MKRRTPTDFVALVRQRWPSPPDWVIVLAEVCTERTQTAVARQLNYSASAISATLANTYRGDIDSIAERVRGAFMNATVPCPIKGELSRDLCLKWQDKPFAATSADRVRMYHACRSGCPHSRLKGE